VHFRFGAAQKDKHQEVSPGFPVRGIQMGNQEVVEATGENRRLFVKRLLRDVAALERVLEEDLIEEGVRRIGAEQEMFLVDRSWHPAPQAMALLEKCNDPRFTTELALFNLELNLDPILFEGDCLSLMEKDLRRLLEGLQQEARTLGVDLLLTGILPTLQKYHLNMDNMTPMPRYRALNDALERLRGKEYRVHIKGTDELIIQHETVMLEACNTSFQLHFQVGPNEFAHLYNVAQLIAGPLLASATNSPLLFGKNLWSETRIALFQQAVDTRPDDLELRQVPPRVSFGERWVHSVLDIFREDIASFRVLFSIPEDEDPFESMRRGRPPQLKALCLHNGTIYRWNRPCYGVSQGQPHLRIENRVLPAGPTVLDEIANAAFYYGLMCGLSSQYEDITRHIDFESVKGNFLAAARFGLRAQFRWINGETIPAQTLIRKTLLPLAWEGLRSREITSGDIEKYLGIIEQRVASEQTGAEWLCKSYGQMSSSRVTSQRLAALTAATASRQYEGKPVHTWPLARLREAGEWKPNYMRVEQFMRTELFTVSKDETVGLVASLMDWQRIRHVPVEDENHRLVGLVSYRSLLRFFARQSVTEKKGLSEPVAAVMTESPITVTPETSTIDAIHLMRDKQIGCLPVVQNNRLVGLITERNFLSIAREMVEDKLKE
jgi:CBS domain-containing protein